LFRSQEAFADMSKLPLKEGPKWQIVVCIDQLVDRKNKKQDDPNLKCGPLIGEVAHYLAS